jgi:hypothetical protein
MSKKDSGEQEKTQAEVVQAQAKTAQEEVAVDVESLTTADSHPDAQKLRGSTAVYHQRTKEEIRDLARRVLLCVKFGVNWILLTL